MAEQKHVRLNTRLYVGRDDDLIEWLDALPHGEKSNAIKETLRRGLSTADDDIADEAPAAAPAPPADTTVAGLDRQTLVEIRRIVETAIESALQQYGIDTAKESPVVDGADDDEADKILSMLDAGITLD